jgi:hypothetical protein
VVASKLTLTGSKVGVRVRCAARPCAGNVSLRTLGRRARTLGTAKVRIAAGKTSTVKIGLSARNRKRVGPRGLAVSVLVDLGAAGKVTRNATLRRGR